MFKKLLDSLFSVFSEDTKNRLRYSKLNFAWSIYINFRLAHSGKSFFGQNDEDRILHKYLSEPQGQYLDIGAGWPVRGSNSYYFYKMGWNGITVDPIRNNILLHKIFRRRDSQIKALIGNTEDSLLFYQFEPYEYSTANTTVAEEVRKRDGVELIAVKRFKVMRLDSFQLRAHPSEATFLSIDVEGKDLEVLQSNNWNVYLPRVICIEVWSRNNEYESQIIQLLESVGYVQTEMVSVSRIFVHAIYLNERR